MRRHRRRERAHLTLGAADVGKTIRSVVTATNAGGSASASSAATAVVVPEPPANTAQPEISGTTINGRQLSASTGTWTNSPTSYADQWQRCDAAAARCAAIASATQSTYTLTGADVGATIRVAVTARNAGGQATATSDPTGVVAPAAPTNTARPVITGTAASGQTLTATTARGPARRRGSSASGSAATRPGRTAPT